MKIYIGGDHYTIEFISLICKYLKKKKIEYIYFGSKNAEDKVKLEEFIEPVCRELIKNNTSGILVCGTGAGVTIGANKIKGIRAALCRKIIDAEWAKSKDNANVLCLSSWDTSEEELFQILDNWFQTKFDNKKIMSSMEIMDNWR